MKNRIFTKLFIVVLAICCLSSCSDRLDIVFTDYYVCIKDEYGAATSNISSEVDDLTMTYYIYLVSPVLDHSVTVDYEIISGDGLTEGIDYTLFTDSRSVTISRGVTRMPIRITYNSNALDPTKDNTLTIRLTSCSDPSLIIGYPGPAANYSKHIVTKR